MKKFEGIYYRLNTLENQSLVLIIGANMSGKDPHAFIQVIDEINSESKYYKFPLEVYSRIGKTKWKIGENIFSLDRLSLALDDYKGDIELEECVELGESIMGPLAGSRILPCMHEIYCLHAKLKGCMDICDKKIDFTEGVGYIEGDSGNMFPKKYIWMQSNTVTDKTLPKTCITGAFTRVLGKRLFYFVFMLGEKIYRFTSYDYGKIEDVRVVDNKKGRKINIEFVQNNIRVELEFFVTETTYDLKYPDKGKMLDGVEEGIDSVVIFKMYNILDEKEELVYDITYTNCGSEIKFFN